MHASSAGSVIKPSPPLLCCWIVTCTWPSHQHMPQRELTSPGPACKHAIQLIMSWRLLHNAWCTGTACNVMGTMLPPAGIRWFYIRWRGDGRLDYPSRLCMPSEARIQRVPLPGRLRLWTLTRCGALPHPPWTAWSAGRRASGCAGSTSHSAWCSAGPPGSAPCTPSLPPAQHSTAHVSNIGVSGPADVLHFLAIWHMPDPAGLSHGCMPCHPFCPLAMHGACSHDTQGQ